MQSDRNTRQTPSSSMGVGVSLRPERTDMTSQKEDLSLSTKSIGTKAKKIMAKYLID